MFYEVPQSFRKELEVVLALGQKNRGPPFLDCANDVVENELVAAAAVSELSIDLLNSRVSAPRRALERCLANEEPMFEGPSGGVHLCIDGEARSSELHFRNRVVTVAALRSRCKPDDEASLHLRKNPFE